MIERNGNTLQVGGAMTIAQAARLRNDGLALLDGGIVAVDLAGVAEVDSSALAVLLAWKRAAGGQGRVLEVRSPPASLTSLAGLYRLTDLLGVPA